MAQLLQELKSLAAELVHDTNYDTNLSSDSKNSGNARYANGIGPPVHLQERESPKHITPLVTGDQNFRAVINQNGLMIGNSNGSINVRVTEFFLQMDIPTEETKVEETLFGLF